MTHPHPSEAGFADAYSRAWTSEPIELLDFFAPESYLSTEGLVLPKR